MKIVNKCMRIIYLFILSSFVFTACNNDENDPVESKYCWQIYDALGNAVTVLCEKTESEIAASYTIYDRQDALKFCWKVLNGSGGFGYVENQTDKIVRFFHPTAADFQKVACGFCQRWLSREKGLHKSTGMFAYQPVRSEQYCGDTATTLFVGRIITIRDTPDSLITVEFLERR